MLAKISIMIHETTSIAFVVFAVATVATFALAEKRNSMTFTNLAIASFALTILSVIGAFFTI